MSADSLSNAPQVKWGIPAALFLSACAFVTPQIVIAFLAPLILEVGLGQNTQTFFIMAAAQALTVACIILFIRAYGGTLGAVGLNAFRLRYIGIAALAFAAYLCAAYVITNLLPVPDQPQELGFSAPSSAENVLIFVALVILAPLAEEILFRGFMFTGLRTRLGFWAATLIVSMLFGLAHGQLNVAIDVFLLSILLCAVREKTNSLWPAILLHMIKNSLAFYYVFVIGVSG